MNLATITGDKARLEEVEWAPFRAAIRSGTDSVMTAHIAVPALDDPGIPATLSPKILTGILRDELGFKGIVVTDALEMGGIAQGFSATQAALGHGPTTGRAVHPNRARAQDTSERPACAAEPIQGRLADPLAVCDWNLSHSKARAHRQQQQFDRQRRCLGEPGKAVDRLAPVGAHARVDIPHAAQEEDRRGDVEHAIGEIVQPRHRAGLPWARRVVPATSQPARTMFTSSATHSVG